MNEVDSSGVYRAESGLIFRITESAEGGVRVDVLKDSAWVPGRIGMAGLRLSSSTEQLGPSAVLKLPT